MKRIICWLLAAVLILSLAACGEDRAEEQLPVEEVEEVIAPAPEVEEETVEEPAPVEEEKPTEEKPAEEKPATSGGTTNKTVTIPQSEKAYLARINLTHCTVNIYTKDESGAYTVPAKAMICSTGYATPKAGTFYRIGNTWEWLRLKGNVYGHYVTQITGNILFHSVPYLRWGDPASLEYWEFDKLGVKASQGCIRLQVSDAIWIYNNAWNIVGVEFYADEEPGPFGKPTAPKISDNEFCRDWDPTDPNPDNPWHDHVESGVEEGIDPETGLPFEGGESGAVEGEGTESVTPEDGTETSPAEGESEGDASAEESTPAEGTEPAEGSESTEETEPAEESAPIEEDTAA